MFTNESLETNEVFSVTFFKFFTIFLLKKSFVDVALRNFVLKIFEKIVSDNFSGKIPLNGDLFVEFCLEKVV